MDEITELRRRGVNVAPCSVRRPAESLNSEAAKLALETEYIFPISLKTVAQSLLFGFPRIATLANIAVTILRDKDESINRRCRTFLHTLLGVVLATRLRPHQVEHIHVHHGYFGSWVAMVAARLLNASFSMTLHGSDLLLHPHFLREKLRSCKRCFTVSEFNRKRILERCQEIAPEKVVLRRMGVAIPQPVETQPSCPARFSLLAVGRLHPVKNYKFLLEACRLLKERRIEFSCVIAGEGSDRTNLERSIIQLNLERSVSLTGHLDRQQLDENYRHADLVVLTSLSEGIPVVLMEAMARDKLVLAPNITGIPELVCHRKTGFLYPAGSLKIFVDQIEEIRGSLVNLDHVRKAARMHVQERFNRETNLAEYADHFLGLLKTSGNSHATEANRLEDSLLQQI